MMKSAIFDKQQSLIESVDLSGATFTGEKQVIHPTFINFFFGTNGSGKSTIAKQITASDNSVHWRSGEDPSSYSVLLFNREFVEENFSTYGDVPGVFMLGAENIQIQQLVDKKSKELEQIIGEERRLRKEKEDLNSKLSNLKDKLYKECTDKTSELRHCVLECLKPYSKNPSLTPHIMELVANVSTGNVNAQYHHIDELRSEYDKLYKSELKKIQFLKKSSDAIHISLTGFELLETPIQSRSDTDFSRFIRALKATDWVSQGYHLYVKGKGNNTCPFCQRDLPDTFVQDIEDCFDAQYAKDIDDLNQLKADYKRYIQQYMFVLKANRQCELQDFDQNRYERMLLELDKVFEQNLSLIEKKINSPSECVTLVDDTPLISNLDRYIEEINKKIEENNSMVDNISSKREALKAKVWQHVLYLTMNLIIEYNSDVTQLEHQIADTDKALQDQGKLRNDLQIEINNLKSKVTNTSTAAESINRHIRNSGFQGFSLREKAHHKNMYEVVRQDGSLADRLSEGEQSFIAFLYFYHEVYGGKEENSLGKSKIVIIDDPVSSLDSNALFLTASLVRDLVNVCSNNVSEQAISNKGSEAKGNFIKQIFIFSHNAFFHREVTKDLVQHYRYVAFFKVSKRDNVSSVVACITEETASKPRSNYDPVVDPYAALWEEYINLNHSTALLNVCRRILSYYFIQICGHHISDLSATILDKYKSLLEKGECTNQDVAAVRGMIAYLDQDGILNSGMYYNQEEVVDCCVLRNVMKSIFSIMNQSQHYEMMLAERGAPNSFCN